METIISGIFSVLIGIACIYFGFKMKKWREQVSGWSRTMAKVISKSIGERKILPGTARNNYRIYIQYEFNVNKRTYLGDVLNLIELQGGEESMMMSTATRELKKIGDKINIYYNPSDPTQSIARIGGSSFWYLLMIIGILMIFIGFIVNISSLI